MKLGVCGPSWGGALLPVWAQGDPSHCSQPRSAASRPALHRVAPPPAFQPSSFSPCQPVGGGNWILGVVSICFIGTRCLQ